MPITRLKNELGFDYYFKDTRSFKDPLKIKLGISGYGFPSVQIRWCNYYLKRLPLNKYFKGKNSIQYIGIAYDEPKRIKNKPNLLYPLVEWKMTEKDCLEYCKSKGFDFGGLYNHFNRLGCWLCPLQSFKDLRTLRKYYKNLWSKLLDYDTIAIEKWKANKSLRGYQWGNDYTVHDLDSRFEIEEILGCQSSRKFALGWRQKVKEYQENDKVLDKCSWYINKLY